MKKPYRLLPQFQLFNLGLGSSPSLAARRLPLTRRILLSLGLVLSGAILEALVTAPHAALAQAGKAAKTDSGARNLGTQGGTPPANSRGLAFLHTPPRPQDLPYPGQTMTITAALTNTKETKLQVRVAMVRDGRFVEIPAREAYLDKFDRPIYEIPTIAPVGEMIYQLLLVQPDGAVVSSPRFAVRRACTPQVDLSEGNVPADVQGVERLRKLVIESKGLENDLNGYNQVLKLLGELKGVVGE